MDASVLYRKGVRHNAAVIDYQVGFVVRGISSLPCLIPCLSKCDSTAHVYAMLSHGEAAIMR